MRINRFPPLVRWVLLILCGLAATLPLPAQTDAPNRWRQLQQDPVGARRASAIRYVPEQRALFLWGFPDSNPDLLQEHPLMEVPEYDMVTFDPAVGRWQNHFPKAWEQEWSKKLPLAYIPRTYSGITTGSERTVLRSPTNASGAAPRPDLNLVFDQVEYHPPSNSLLYFTGGLTAAYNVAERRWSDLAPRHTPPPVMGGSLAYDSVNDEMVLFGGGHVAETGPAGKVVGYTGTWTYSFAERDWRRLASGVEPPPRMSARVVLDSHNGVLVVFGGDGQSHYLADTWLYDLRSRTWRQSKAAAGPPPRAGHFTVYDEASGWVIIGGGYNREDLNDMWAYDAKQDRWQRLKGEAPTGFYITADLDAENHRIYLVSNTKKLGDTSTCNELFPVRTTFSYQLDGKTALHADQVAQRHEAMPKRPLAEATQGTEPDAERSRAQAERLRDLAINQWTSLAKPGRVAPMRTWGSGTLDTDRGRILYWGGGHCGYGGSDVDAYDIDTHTWLSGDPAPEYPERAWNKGVREGGVTFGGAPWMTHGRSIYAYDPVSHKMIMSKRLRLTMGYDPGPLQTFAESREPQAAALVSPPSSYVKYSTWSYDQDTHDWMLLGSAPAGVDTLVSTPHGVMGVPVDWPDRLNDSGYDLPWSPDQPEVDNTVYLYKAASRQWLRLGGPQHSPQNLYELTSIAYDSKRDQLILHGAGKNRDELWTFDLKTNRWNKLQPMVAAPKGAQPPAASREAVYIPRDDVFLVHGRAPDVRGASAMWAYSLQSNEWTRLDMPQAPGVEASANVSQNRVMLYDEKRDVLLLVLGTRGDDGQSHVFAMRYRHGQAPVFKR